VSEIGPGKPYCKMPDGLTGETRDGTGCGPGSGGRGVVRVGMEGVSGVDVVGVGSARSVFERRRRAVRDAPVAQEAAAMRASVDFDMSVRKRVEDGPQC